MPYQKSGVLNDFSKRTRRIIIIAAVVLVLAAALLISYAAAPRDFMQFFLSDSSYAGTVLYKNVNEDLPKVRKTLTSLTENHAYSVEGSVKYEFSDKFKSELGAGKTAAQAESYMNSTTFSGDIDLAGSLFDTTLAWKDEDGTLMTADVVNGNTGVYLNIEELGIGWVKMVGGSEDRSGKYTAGDKTIRKLLSSDDRTIKDRLYSAAKAGYKDAGKDILIREESNMTCGVDTKTCEGDRVQIVADKDNAVRFTKAAFKAMKGDDRLFDAANRVLGKDAFDSRTEYEEYLDGWEARVLKEIKTTNVTKVSLDMYVDKHNDITGFEIFVKRDSGDLIMNAVITDRSGKGSAIKIRNGQETVFDADITKQSEKTGYVDITIGSYVNRINYSNFSLGGDGLPYGTFVLQPKHIESNEELGDVSFVATFVKNSNKVKQAALEIDSSTYGNAVINTVLTEKKTDGINEPAGKEVKKNGRKKLQNALLKYMIGTLPKTHKEYSTTVTGVVSSYVSNYLAQVDADPTS